MKTQNRTVTKGRYAFDEEQHLHTLDGKPLTGVTTVLSVINKPALIQWSANMACDYVGLNLPVKRDGDTLSMNADEYLKILKEARSAHRKKKESAGEWGTNIHSMVESVINDAMEQNGGYIRPFKHNDSSVNHFIAWAIEHKVKFLGSEKHVYSENMWIGGIADIVCEIDGKLYVGDVKTSSGIYPEHFIQCSAYAGCLKEMGDYNKFDGVVILNLKKNGMFDHKFNYDVEGNLKCFEAALTLYRHLNAINPN